MSLSLVLLASAFAKAQYGSAPGQWPTYGGDSGHTKYSNADQINRDNVGMLQIAWTWTSIDEDIRKKNEAIARNPDFRIYAHEVTPLMIDGVLYTTTSLGQVAAIDPTTGRTLWSYDPLVYLEGRPTVHGFLTRGLAYWAKGEERRLLYGAGRGYLISIDVKTGKPDPLFGDHGQVDLKNGLGRTIDASQYGVSSPPLVIGDSVIVGSSITEGSGYKMAPPGHVRAYDVRSGDLRWTFHTIPQPGEYGNETWKEGSWQFAGGANVWTMMSADEALGYVYLAIGSPATDFYGGHRPGDNLFANSLVCLDAETGKRIWHFQIVHHSVWDYDLPAAPNLMNITVGDRKIRAVAQITKQGFVFVFDRQTGEPVWPIEERPVPQSTVRGERTSATQPYPTKPPMFLTTAAAKDSLIDFTPELNREGLQILRRHQAGSLYSPPALGSNIVRPGRTGGANWWGAGVDPETSHMYVPSWAHYSLVFMQDNPDRRRSDLAVWPQVGDVEGPQGLPLFKPPYAQLTAFDMNRGERLWGIPLGDGPRDHAALKRLKLPPLGTFARPSGPLVTKTLLFISEGMQPARFHALDKSSGKEVWVMDLPARSAAAPMTYVVDGSQYIVLAIGGRGTAEKLIALSLPLDLTK